MPPLAASILFHAIGATSAACCYVPQKKVSRWSWQTYWLTQAAFCWLLLPILGAFLTVPEYWRVANSNGAGRFAPRVAGERLKPAESRRSGRSASVPTAVGHQAGFESASPKQPRPRNH
ncbi:MAG: hypothetical protein NT154_41595, partial [Verrucomicrobia bacterium]|nr:hypothetical protein [Verrucomicrobiota bacterium]